MTWSPGTEQLAGVLGRIQDYKINRIGEPLPWNWKFAPKLENAA